MKQVKRIYHKSWRDTIRTAILLRDSCKCFICKHQSTSNHVHHCDSNPLNNAPLNLVVVCPTCHLLLSRGRAHIVFDNDYSWSEHQKVFNMALVDFLAIYNNQIS